jgi:hypothetical protein
VQPEPDAVRANVASSRMRRISLLLKR